MMTYNKMDIQGLHSVPDDHRDNARRFWLRVFLLASKIHGTIRLGEPLGASCKT